MNILNEIAAWIPANGEGIYGTRPWKIYGEGPATVKKQEKGRFGGLKDVRPYEPSDIRFTSKGETLYAFCMGVPESDVKINSLGKISSLSSKKIASVRMLGSAEKISWKQENDALVISRPSKLPEWPVITFKIEFKK